MVKISIIVPVLNDAKSLACLLSQLKSWQESDHEIIVVDGGSSDDSLRVAAQVADLAVQTRAGRSAQMNYGASMAKGDVLLFLHCDSELDAAAEAELVQAVQARGPLQNGPVPLWGRFDVVFDNPGLCFRIIAGSMNLRSRVTSVATGDQGIFVSAETFQHCGGYADIPLMEDVELCKRLRKVCSPVCLHRTLVTSARRWERHGTVKTVCLMWWLRLQYFCGVSPDKLVKKYYKKEI